MKFADIEVGKSYKNSMPGPKRVVFKTDRYAVVETHLPYPVVYGPNEDNFSNWVEVKRVKLYCALYYHSKIGAHFAVTRDSQAGLDLYKDSLLKTHSEWKLIREYTEEFNTV